MNNQIEAAIKEVEKFNDSIIDALDSKNITNTGEAARSIYIDFGENFVRSIGIFYLEFLDTGRGPGRWPPYKPLADWVETKLGIPRGNPRFESTVYFVRKKIADLGTEIFLRNGEGIELTEKIVTLRENLRVALRESTILTIKQKLDRFKKLYHKKKFKI